MTNQTIEKAVVETSRHFCNGIALQLEPSNEVMKAIRLLNKELPKALQAQRDAGVEKGRISVLEDFDSLMQAYALIGFSADEWKAVQKFFQFNDEISGWKEALTPPTK